MPLLGSPDGSLCGIKAGTDALARGEFTEVDDADLEGYLERLKTSAAKRAR